MIHTAPYVQQSDTHLPVFVYIHIKISYLEIERSFLILNNHIMSGWDAYYTCIY